MQKSCVENYKRIISKMYLKYHHHAIYYWIIITEQLACKQQSHIIVPISLFLSGDVVTFELLV